MIFLAGPGHGGPAVVRQRLARGHLLRGLPRRHARRARAAPPVPAVLDPRRHPEPRQRHRRRARSTRAASSATCWSHAFGAAFDNPDLIVVAVVGDGEAETGPLEGSWKGIRFLNPTRDGAVLPILHLNGYKIAGPTVLGRASDDDVRSLLAGHGYDVHVRRGRRAAARSTRTLAATLDDCVGDDPRDPGRRARAAASRGAPALAGDRAAHAEGLDRPEGGRRHAGRGHLPRAPGAASATPRRTPSTWRMLEAWMRSYRPEELFDERRPPACRARGAGAEGRPAHERQPARQRRRGR